MYCHDKAYLSKREHQRVQEIESEAKQRREVQRDRSQQRASEGDTHAHGVVLVITYAFCLNE